MKTAVNFRQIILEQMENKGMTQSALARSAKMTCANLSDYLSGKADIKTTTLERLLEALEIDPAFNLPKRYRVNVVQETIEVPIPHAFRSSK